MSLIDRIRGVFGRKKSSAEYGTAATGAAFVATTTGDPTPDADDNAAPDIGGAESGGGFGGGDVGGAGGGGGDGGGGVG
jgi:hypothetical protein